MEISIDCELDRFSDFIQIESNDNIIFSGKFGIGKSYFIKKFFEANEEKYLEIYLSPVNYSVSSNEDIFEYIKLNILFELLEKTPYQLSKGNISFSAGTLAYMKKNTWSFISKVFMIGEKIAYGTNITEKLLNLKKDIDTYIQENSGDENKEVEEFVSKMGEMRGSIYENDIITQLIRSIINSYKANEKNKKIVLVVDDLDRIDPEHIFRILNVLSAHQNFCGTDEHKFGIDKTVLVCDVANLKKIYHGHHGGDVDFCGYIDKFYSKEVFHFNNLDNIFDSLWTVLLSTKVEYVKIKALYSREWNDLLEFIIKKLFKNSSINLRTFLKIQNKKFNVGRNIWIDKRRIFVHNCPSIFFFDVLTLLFPTLDEMQNAINSLDLGMIQCDDWIVSAFITLSNLDDGYVFDLPLYYLRCEYRTQSLHENSLMAQISPNNELIPQTQLIQDSCSNYIKYCQ